MHFSCVALAALALMAACSGSSGAGGHASPDAGSAGSGFLLDSGASCVDASAPDAAADAGCTPSQSPVGFSADVVPILSARCAGEACHGSTGWSAWDSLAAGRSHECCDQRRLVVPGAPDQSYLIDKLTGHGMCTGLPMPRNGTPLSQAELRTIYDWICLGAKND